MLPELCDRHPFYNSSRNTDIQKSEKMRKMEEEEKIGRERTREKIGLAIYLTLLTSPFLIPLVPVKKPLIQTRRLEKKYGEDIPSTNCISSLQ